MVLLNSLSLLLSRVRLLFEFAHSWRLLIPLNLLFLQNKRIILPLNGVARREHCWRLYRLSATICIVYRRWVWLSSLVICVIHIIIVVLFFFGLNIFRNLGCWLYCDIASGKASLALVFVFVKLDHWALFILSRWHRRCGGTVLGRRLESCLWINLSHF